MEVVEKVILQNDRFRIVVRYPDMKDKIVTRRYNILHRALTIGIRCWVDLEERRWFFGRFWLVVGTTNLMSIVDEWKSKYFPQKEN